MTFESSVLLFKPLFGGHPKYGVTINNKVYGGIDDDAKQNSVEKQMAQRMTETMYTDS